MRFRILAPLAAALFNTSLVLPIVPAQADEADFLSRFDGKWNGGGSMKPTAKAPSVPLDCSAKGDTGARTLSLGGQCSALILSRTMSADLKYDAGTGRYTGVYVTEGDPPAALNGTRAGDALVLAVKWPKPVNGDSDATMIIRNTGQGKFSFTVRDAVEPGGAIVTTANFTLSKEDQTARVAP